MKVRKNGDWYELIIVRDGFIIIIEVELFKEILVILIDILELFFIFKLIVEILGIV